MLTAKQVRDIIASRTEMMVPLRTIYSWMNRKVLKTRKLGGRLWVSSDDLEFFLSDFMAADKQLA